MPKSGGALASPALPAPTGLSLLKSRLLMVHCLIVKGNRVFARAYLRSRCQRGSNSYQSWTSDHRQNQEICLLQPKRLLEGDIPSTVGCGAPIFLRNIETVKLCFQLTQFSLNFPIRAMQFFPPKLNVLASTLFLKFIEILRMGDILKVCS